MLSSKTRDGVSKLQAMEDVEVFRDLGGLPDMGETNVEPHSFSNLWHTTTMWDCAPWLSRSCTARCSRIAFRLFHVHLACFKAMQQMLTTKNRI